MRSRAAAVDAVRETWTFAPRVHGLVRELAACQGTARAGIPSLDIGSQSDVAYLTGEFSREAGTGHVSAASLPYPAFLRLVTGSGRGAAAGTAQASS